MKMLLSRKSAQIFKRSIYISAQTIHVTPITIDVIRFFFLKISSLLMHISLLNQDYLFRILQPMEVHSRTQQKLKQVSIENNQNQREKSYDNFLVIYSMLKWNLVH